MRPRVVALLCLFAAVAANAEPAGVYKLVTTSPVGEMRSTLTINADGTGNVSSTFASTAFEDADFDGDDFAFTMIVDGPMGAMTIAYTGTVDGDTISGTIVGPLGDATFTGTRQAVASNSSQETAADSADRPAPTSPSESR